MRGMLTRPDISRVMAYRAYVDAAVARLIAQVDAAHAPEALRILDQAFGQLGQ